MRMRKAYYTVFTWTAVMAKRQASLLSMFSRVKDTDEDGSDHEEIKRRKKDSDSSLDVTQSGKRF